MRHYEIVCAPERRDRYINNRGRALYLVVSVVFRVFCVAVKLCTGEISVSFDSSIVVIFLRQNQSLVDLFLDTFLAYILNGNRIHSQARTSTRFCFLN